MGLLTFFTYGPKLHLSCVAAWFSDTTEKDSYKFPFTEPKVSLPCSEEKISVVPVLNEMHAVHALTLHEFENHFITIISFTLKSSK